MQPSRIPIVLVLVFAGTAAAQTPDQTEQAIAAAFRSRLAAELAIHGISLSRRNLNLQLWHSDTWLLSLVDLNTGQVVASIEFTQLPKDREAAVAVMINAVADLASQTGHRGDLPPQASLPTASSGAPSLGTRTERTQRQLAEAAFKRESFRFGQPGTSGRRWRWQVFRGGLDQELDPPAFYRALGREDLAHAYDQRHSVMISGYLVSALAFSAAAALSIGRISDFQSCNHLAADTMPNCEVRSVVPVLVAVGVGLAGTAVGGYFSRNPHPIDENEAKALADAYNQRLRRQLGLPVVTRHPTMRGLALAPYVASYNAGLAVSAPF